MTLCCIDRLVKRLSITKLRLGLLNSSESHFLWKAKFLVNLLWINYFDLASYHDFLQKAFMRMQSKLQARQLDCTTFSQYESLYLLQQKFSLKQLCRRNLAFKLMESHRWPLLIYVMNKINKAEDTLCLNANQTLIKTLRKLRKQAHKLNCEVMDAA